MFLVAADGSADAQGLPGLRVVRDDRVTVLGRPGHDLLLFEGVLYPDGGMTPERLLRMLRSTAGASTAADWAAVKGRYAGAYLCARPSGTRLLAFNDHLGVADLYSWVEGSDRTVRGFAVSNAFAALLPQLPASARRLDGRAADAFRVLGATVNGRTFARGVRRQPPGTLLALDAGTVRRARSWRYRFEPAARDMDEALDRCWRLIERAGRRIEACAPQGGPALLGISGGHDSRVTGAACVTAGMELTGYFFGERHSSAGRAADQVARALGTPLGFPGRNRELPRYFAASLRHQPMADLEWCKYLPGRDALVAGSRALLSGRLGDHLFSDKGHQPEDGPQDDRGIAADLFRELAKEEAGAAAEGIVADITQELAGLGGSGVQRRRGFNFQSMSMSVKQCGLFHTLGTIPHYSVFEDIDVFESALDLPNAWRVDNRFYDTLLERRQPPLARSRIAVPTTNEHKPIEHWLCGNAEFAAQAGQLLDPAEDMALHGRRRTFGEALEAILAGRATRNEIHQYFRRATVKAYERTHG
ncbi:hypothetical protein ACFC0M_03320 [Streptomyces sp. NPDC056149]|uniref:hypothetical protein n=1 Tax=unclassified Streptomyces TaxID=2593676 RepID=UPI00238155DD|nr:hypothetical protein [Streptomyces sp. WZ-12]